MHQLTQVLALPLRRALGLPRSTSAQRTIWEYALPDVGSIQMRTLLQYYNRSCSHFRSDPNSLPALFASDVSDLAPPDPARPSSHQSVPALLKSALTLFPDLKFPATTATINKHIAQLATSHWENTAKHHHRVSKPDSDTPLYLSVDKMPAAVIRGRLRLDKALSFEVMWKYKSIASPRCHHCDVLGSVSHILLYCPVFQIQRAKCTAALQNLYYPIELTMSLLRGEPPPRPRDRTLHSEQKFLHSTHIKCLNITGEYLTAVSRVHFL